MCIHTVLLPFVCCWAADCPVAHITDGLSNFREEPLQSPSAFVRPTSLLFEHAGVQLLQRAANIVGDVQMQQMSLHVWCDNTMKRCMHLNAVLSTLLYMLSVLANKQLCVFCGMENAASIW